ncbi:tetratricopeptide repeat protein [Galbibacter orientalis]|uniref:ATP-binding response regulator n=1 Tax=Galbibacter orientalis TaxID=453852 RepID=UPI003080ACA7
MKGKTVNILTFLTLLIFSLGYTQNIEIDSLYTKLKNAPTAIDSIALYSEIAEITTNIDPNEAILLSEKLLLLSEKNSNLLGIATAYNIIGASNVYLSNHNSAIDYLNKGLEIAENNNLNTIKASIYNHLGKVHRFKSNHYVALKYYDKAIAISKELNNTPQIAECLKNISILYTLVNEYDTSIELLDSALVIHKKNNDQYGIVSIQKNLAFINSYKGLPAPTLSALKKVYRYEDSLGYTFRKLLTQMYIGNLYYESENLTESKEEFEYALLLLNQVNNNIIREDCYMSLAKILRKLGDDEKALDYALKAFETAEKHQVYANSIETANLLSNLYEQKEDYKNALKFSQIGYTYRNSLQLNKVQNTLLKERLKLDLKELSIQKEKELNDLKVKKNKYIIIGGFISFIIVTMLIYFSRIKLARINKRLTISNEIKSNFLTKMTHEVKTPLNAIIGYADLLLKFKDLTSVQNNHINIIKSSGESLLYMAEDIFDFNRYDKNKISIKQNSTDLRALANEIFEMFKIRAQEKNLSLFLNTSTNIPKTLLIDDLKIRRVVYSLLDNAIKYTSKGSVTLNVILVNVYEKTTEIKFSIDDTGKGIKTKNQNKIFEEFYQEESDYTREHGGIGLGLSISCKIVKALGGILQFESEVNKGSKFYFKLTFTNSSEEKVDSNPIQNLANEIENKIFKVLIVEDNKVNLLITKKLLSSLYKNALIYEAYDGKMGVELYSKEQPNIILMDIQMPVLNGLEATKIIRRKYNATIPILALSAGSAVENREKSISVGISEYLEKPINLKKLRETIYKYLTNL